MKKLSLLIGLLFLLSSCSTFNCTPLESWLGGQENLINFSHTIADDLLEFAMPPLIPMNPNQPVIITTFVSNDNLKETSQFGRLVQEHVASRLVQQGYTVKEIKLRKNLLIEPKSGETVLSRHLQNLTKEYAAQAFLSGTYSISGRTMYLNARLIRPSDSAIISSQDYKLCMDDNVLEMFGLMRTTGECTDCIEEPSQPLLNNVFY